MFLLPICHKKPLSWTLESFCRLQFLYSLWQDTISVPVTVRIPAISWFMGINNSSLSSWSTNVLTALCMSESPNHGIPNHNQTFCDQSYIDFLARWAQVFPITLICLASSQTFLIKNCPYNQWLQITLSFCVHQASLNKSEYQQLSDPA